MKIENELDKQRVKDISKKDSTKNKIVKKIKKHTPTARQSDKIAVNILVT